MATDFDKWLKCEGEIFLKNIGIKKGQVILDFGCGVGHYTIPASKVVGKDGRVYAVDKDKKALDQLRQIAESEGLRNIVPICNQSGKLKIDLENESIDVLLLYDVLHYYYFETDERKKLLKEIHRIAKANALISIFPKHMELEVIEKEVKNAGFYLERKLFKKLIHDDSYDKGYILNFRKW